MKTIKKPISILLSVLMVLSLFAAVPMTVNAAPPGSGSGEIGPGGTGTEIGPVHGYAGFATQPSAIEGLVANGSEQALISAGTTADGATAYYYMTTEDITGEQANSLFNSPSKPGSFSTSIPKGTDAGTYYVWYAIDGGSNYEDLFPYVEINNQYESHKLTVTIAAPTYTVTWKDDNGTDIGTATVAEGETPTYPDPTKPDDDTNTYTFSGWDPTPVAAIADATYTAKFDATPKHEHDGITFKEWTHADRLPSTAGNYVLTSDVTLPGTWTVPAGETNLCLAGHTIRLSGGLGSVIQLNNANQKLTVYDDGTTGTITGGNTTGNGGGVNITAGTFMLKGGNIEGNVASNGGGVSVVGSSSSFTMDGGTVRYNEGYTYTGGVVQMSSGNFTMTGGTIQNNVGKEYGGVGIYGAQPSMSGTAVVKDNVLFTDVSQTNTKITKNDSGYTLASGGTPCDVKHGASNGLKINVTGAFENGAKIGIFNNSQTAVFTNGYKTNNPNDDPADYFFCNDTNYLVKTDFNGEVQLRLNGSSVASVTVGETTIEYASFAEALSAWTDNSTLTLLADVTTSSTISVSGTKTLDLNGYELKMTGSGRVIAIPQGASLTLNDVEENTGRITGGNADRGAGVRNDGTFIMNGGTITGNTASYHGGGVYTITADASFIMNGGIITGNTANRLAGGVCVSGPFTMNGGKITNNTSNGTGGGGVYVDSSFVMNGGEISSNNASNNGGGVYVNGGTLTLSGSAVIKNNTKGGSATNNVYLPNNKTINITDALTCDDGSIGITMQNRGVFTNSTNTSFNDPTKFFSDDSNYGVFKNAAGQLELRKALFVGHSISLEGDIALNFFIDPKSVGATNFNNYSKATVTFTWDEGNGEKYGTASVNLLDPEDKNVSFDTETGRYKVSCNVAAAHMGHKVLAKLYLNSEEPVETNAYSVREYAEEIFAHPTDYVENGDSEKAEKLQNLVQAMLNYGAMAQVVFNDDLVDKTVEPVNKVVGYNGYADVTSDDIADAIKPGASDLNTVATQLTAKYYTTSLLYLSQSKLRVYFTPTTYPGQIPNSGGFTDNKAGYYYYKESNPIAAADLDEQQKLSVNGVDFYVSALDYAKVIVENKNKQMNKEQINLAQALFLYNQAANEYFAK